MISLVMAAWRTRFMLSVNEEIKSPAFFEAASIAVIRAPCSEATDSSRAENLRLDQTRQQAAENLCRRLFVDVILCLGGFRVFGFFGGVGDRQKLFDDYALIQHRLEFGKDQEDLVDLFVSVNRLTTSRATSSASAKSIRPLPLRPMYSPAISARRSEKVTPFTAHRQQLNFFAGVFFQEGLPRLIRLVLKAPHNPLSAVIKTTR